MADIPILYTIDELKTIFKVAESTVWKWLREGRFGDAVRVGRRTYVRAAAVHKYTDAA